MTFLFKTRSKSLTISESDPTYKVKYLGNVLTTFVKGDGCVDRPLAILWNNYLANPSLPKEMQLTVTNYGLKAMTKEQGLMEYRCHRIVYSIHHPQYPKLFVWVYRHEGRKMKVEVRCHAALCKTDQNAKTIEGQLKQRLAFALAEFMREKLRRQNARLTIQRTQSVPCGGVGASLPLRTQLLRIGQHFKPPASLSSTAAASSALGAISEELGETDQVQPVAAADRLTARSEGNWKASVRENAIEEEEEEEEDVFMLSSPESVDCRLTDAVPSFFINGEDQTNSSAFDDGDENLSSDRLHQSPLNLSPLTGSLPCILNNGAAYAIPHTASLPSISVNGGKEPCCGVGEGGGEGADLSDPEFLAYFPSSVSLDCDDQSIESGFSEQDAHEIL